MDTQVKQLFKNPEVYQLYQKLITGLEKLGNVTQEPKRESIHLVNTKSFAGIHPRSDYFILNIVSSAPIINQRITKQEQVSKSRFHNETKIMQSDDINSELLRWLKEAYELMA